MEPIKIRMTKTVRPDSLPSDIQLPINPGTILHVGQEYDAESNPYGVVSGICENGEQFGVKPEEFEFLTASEDLRKIHEKVENHPEVAEDFSYETFKERIKKVVAEIESKKMVTMGMVIKVLEEHGEYCEHCEADEPTLFYDPTGTTGPTVRCPWCGKSVKVETLIKRARALPHDYLERMIALPAQNTLIEQIGEDAWITNGRLAEIAGDIRLSYPDRDKFKKTDGISKLFDGLDIDQYEEAKISRITYRPKYGGRPLIAELKSKSHTVYINNDFTEYIYGIFIPCIHGPLEPVLIKAHGKISRLIMPVRFDPAELNEES